MNEKQKNAILAKEMIATFQRWIDEQDGDNALAGISPEAMELIKPNIQPRKR